MAWIAEMLQVDLCHAAVLLELVWKRMPSGEAR